MTDNTARAQRIREGVNIVDVVRDTVPLIRGDCHLWRGCCPFDTEKHGLFYVDTEYQTFRCFWCGAGGDAASFVMQRDHLNFAEALDLLEDRYMATNRCPKCQTRFRVPDDESGDHPCPHCGYHPADDVDEEEPEDD